MGFYGYTKNVISKPDITNGYEKVLYLQNEVSYGVITRGSTLQVMGVFLITFIIGMIIFIISKWVITKKKRLILKIK